MLKTFSIILFLSIQIYRAQATLELLPQDSLTYNLQSKSPGWISVKSKDANLAISLFCEGKKVKDQDNSKGTQSVENLFYNPEKNKKYTLKIWAKSYLEKSKKAKIEISELKKRIILDDKLSYDEMVQDIKYFRTIREQVNSGLYVYRNKKEIDSIYNWAIQKAEISETIFDFYKIIAALTQFEGSCHNFTDLPNHATYYLTQKNEYLPFTLKNVEGYLLQNSKGISIPLSAEIISINGILSNDIIKRFSQYYSSDGFTLNYKETAGFEKGMFDKFYIEFGTHKNYKIIYKWNNKEYKVVLPGISFEEFKNLQESRHSLSSDSSKQTGAYSLNKENNDTYRLILKTFDFANSKDDIAYKKFSTFLDNMLLTLEKERIKNLIIDLRGNGGGAGALYEKVFTYFTQRPFRDSQFAYTNFNQIPFKDKLVITPMFLANGVKNGHDVDLYLKQIYPTSSQGKFYWADEKNPLILPNEKVFNGQIYLFIDENVASAGSHLASLFKSYTNAVVIGKETNGGYYEHNGHLPVVYELPNTKIQTGFSVVHVIQDVQNLNDQKKGSGVVPHIKVNQTPKEFLEQTDLYMTKVFELQQKKITFK